MKILLATDGSDCAEDAAKFITLFNLSRNDEILIFHAVSEIPCNDDYHLQIKHAIKRAAPKILDSAEEILAGVKAKITRLETCGYPDTAIMECAETHETNLIVVGARGIRGLKELFLGSTTRSVAIKSVLPVLIVKRNSIPLRHAMNILYATDGSAASESTGRYLSSIPFPEDSTLTVIHIIRSAVSDIPERFIMEINDRMKAETASIRAREYSDAEKLIERTKTTIGSKFSTITSLIKTGDPSLEILDAEKEIKPDLIAVGCRGLRGLKGIMGSVSRRIIDHSSTSVLVGKGCEDIS